MEMAAAVGKETEWEDAMTSTLQHGIRPSDVQGLLGGVEL